jgi:colicin import membrane protein
VIQAQMIDISQIKRTKSEPVKKQTTKPQPPVKKEPPEVKKEVVEPPVKKEVVEPPVKKEPAIIPLKPKEDPKKLEQERKIEEDRKKKLEEIRKKRVQAEQRAKQEEENLKNLAEKIKQEQQDDQPIIVTNQDGPSEYDKLQQLMALYQSSVISSVTRQWNKPATANKNLVCHVRVRQIPGGGVVDAQISTPCNANSIVQKSIIDAILKADPLPYKGFEKVFSRQAVFIFKPEN